MGDRYRDFRVKTYEPERWYHVWNKGLDVLFRDDADRRVFLDCVARFMSPEPCSDERGRPLRWFRDRIELGGYCLLTTHFHLLVRTGSDPAALGEFMQSVKGAFTRECRARGRAGRVFKGPYEADPITDRERLGRAAVYVHLNAGDDPEYRFCSYPEWSTGHIPVWLNGAERLIGSIGGLDAHRRDLDRTIDRRRARREADSYADELAERIRLIKSGR